MILFDWARFVGNPSSFKSAEYETDRVHTEILIHIPTFSVVFKLLIILFILLYPLSTGDGEERATKLTADRQNVNHEPLVPRTRSPWYVNLCFIVNYFLFTLATRSHAGYLSVYGFL